VFPLAIKVREARGGGGEQMLIRKLKASIRRSVNAIFADRDIMQHGLVVSTDCAGKPIGFRFEGQAVQKHELHDT
jgi:hypothetical protein